MTVTDMVELVRVHCPELAKLIRLHETDPCINELVKLAEQVAQDGYDEGRSDGYQDGYSIGFQAGKMEGYQAGYSNGKNYA